MEQKSLMNFIRVQPASIPEGDFQPVINKPSPRIAAICRCLMIVRRWRDVYGAALSAFGFYTMEHCVTELSALPHGF
jgi:hypothetical protein